MWGPTHAGKAGIVVDACDRMTVVPVPARGYGVELWPYANGLLLRLESLRDDAVAGQGR